MELFPVIFSEILWAERLYASRSPEKIGKAFNHPCSPPIPKVPLQNVWIVTKDWQGELLALT
jgi:hypothetical protein